MPRNLTKQSVGRPTSKTNDYHKKGELLRALTPLDMTQFYSAECLFARSSAQRTVSASCRAALFPAVAMIFTFLSSYLQVLRSYLGSGLQLRGLSLENDLTLVHDQYTVCQFQDHVDGLFDE